MQGQPQQKRADDGDEEKRRASDFAEQQVARARYQPGNNDGKSSARQGVRFEPRIGGDMRPEVRREVV
jgi:hypothetical protein